MQIFSVRNSEFIFVTNLLCCWFQLSAYDNRRKNKFSVFVLQLLILNIFCDFSFWHEKKNLKFNGILRTVRDW